MATAKPKTKRMMFGGVAKGAANAVKSAVQSKKPAGVPAFAKPYVNKMMGAAKPQTGVPAFAKPYVNKMMGAAKPQMQFMSDKLRGGAATKPQMQFMSDKLRGVGAATTGVARGMMKKGGVVKKKATKK